MEINLKGEEKTTLVHIAKTGLQKFSEYFIFRSLIPMYAAKREDDKIILHRVSLGFFKTFGGFRSETDIINVNEIQFVKKKNTALEFLFGKSKQVRYIVKLNDNRIIHILIYEDQSRLSSKQKFSGHLAMFLMMEAKKYKK